MVRVLADVITDVKQNVQVIHAHQIVITLVVQTVLLLVKTLVIMYVVILVQELVQMDVTQHV